MDNRGASNMKTTINVRDHELECEHGCQFSHFVVDNFGELVGEYCPGGREMVLEHDDTLPTLGKLWCEMPLSPEAEAVT